MQSIKSPSEIKKMSNRELKKLAEDIRAEIIETVSRQGGHLASNLGAVELTIALHYVFDAPTDKIVFDVGHQTYAHKLVTGRLKSFHALRSSKGTSGFSESDVSDFDAFTTGHASTAISAALGMARTRDIMHGEYQVIAVVGDGALTGGMCYEALNDAGQTNTRLIVILNDNQMSISRNVGAMSRYLTRLRQSRTYYSFKRGIRRGLSKVPGVGLPMFRFIEKIRDSVKSLFVDGKFFDALGFEYIGPIDGHDIKHMIRILRRAKDSEKPMLIHFVTQKGRGYTPAEDRPDRYHGIAPFFVDSGEPRDSHGDSSSGQVAARQLSSMADSDIRVCAVVAAMPTGTGMTLFQKEHPERFFDVGIAEEHAVTMAAGMASTGMKPYVCIYSTFLQRSYDQILMDVCRPSLPVTFLIDRSGLVGADGATHHGVFDLSMLRSMPNMIVAAPRDARELKRMLTLSSGIQGPMAIRYPKDAEDLGPGLESHEPIEVGKWELLSDGPEVMILAVGRMVQMAMQASVELLGQGLNVGVVDARFIKPMDERMLSRTADKAALIVTVEENVLNGGFGEGVARWCEGHAVKADLMMLGIPDSFIPHGTVAEQQAACGLNSHAIARKILEKWMQR